MPKEKGHTTKVPPPRDKHLFDTDATAAATIAANKIITITATVPKIVRIEEPVGTAANTEPQPLLITLTHPTLSATLTISPALALSLRLAPNTSVQTMRHQNSQR